MAFIKLQTGFLEQSKEDLKEVPTYLDRPALLVYAGSFESMDGPVEVKDEHIENLAAQHNSLLSSVKRKLMGDVPLKNYPPIQLDHSTSAKDTVGRLIGELTTGEYELESGKKVKALYGNVRILGKENVEKVLDGRWTHLSIGADLESGKVQELTITPFPAAADASLLKRLKEQYRGTESYQGVKYDIYLDPAKGYMAQASEADLDEMYFDSYREAAQYAQKEIKTQISNKRTKPRWFDDETNMSKLAKTEKYNGQSIKIEEGPGICWYIEIKGIKRGPFQKEEDAIAAGKQIVDSGVLDKIPNATNNYIHTKGGSMFERLKLFLMGTKRFTEEKAHEEMAKMDDVEKEKLAAEVEKHEKMKKHVMKHKHMEEKEAEKHLAEMPDEEKHKLAAEVDEHEKLEADDKEKEKLAEEDHKEENKKLTAKLGELARLASEFKKTSDGTKLQIKKSEIGVRFSKLKSQAKITPAELKKIDISRLAKESEATVSAVLKSYEDREPVILPGMIGSKNAIDASKVAKQVRMSKLEMETRKNMSLLKNTVKMEGDKKEHVSEELAESQPEHVLNKTMPNEEIHEMAHKLAEVHHDNALRALEDGRHEEVKEHLKKLMTHYRKHLGKYMKHMGEEPDAHMELEMSALADSVRKMQLDFDKVMRLTSTIAGE